MSDIPAIGGTALPPPVSLSTADQKRLQGAATEFEAMFIKQMLTAMRKTIPKALPGEVPLIKESEGEKIFRDLLDGEYAKVMSQRKNGLGLKEALLKYLANQTGQAKTDPQADMARLQAQSSTLSALSQMPASRGLGKE
ncbi:MAG: rod-binding protein [Magnetococcales bacterium]|nr:rod-binding protein [Magnetococcales bacterium]